MSTMPSPSSTVSLIIISILLGLAIMGYHQSTSTPKLCYVRPPWKFCWSVPDLQGITEPGVVQVIEAAYYAIMEAIHHLAHMLVCNCTFKV